MRQSHVEWVRMLAVAVVALTVRSALGVVINGGTAANEAAPADDPGWANVGQIGNASGVYLGHFASGDWVLTASHVGAGSTTLNGISYGAVSGSAVQLVNSDLELFRISSSPSLPDLTLAASTPGVGSSVTMVGYGYTGTSTLTAWNTSTSPWTETPSGDAQGYAYDGSSRGTKRWGDNTVSRDYSVTYTVNSVPLTTTVLETTFTGASGSSQLASGDSGGATFLKVGGQWELAGINLAIGTYDGQPSSTAVFGNTSIMGDLAAYAGEIDAITGPVPEPASVGLLLLGALALVLRRR